MKLVKSLALVIGLICVAFFVGATAYQWTLDSDHDGTSEFTVDTDGNLTNTGSLTAKGIVSASSMVIGGTFNALPTSGFNAGAIIYCTASTYSPSGPHFYGSTATVTGVSCWRALSFSGD